MENKTKHVSMFEITKMAHEGKDDFERQLAYEKWLKDKNNLENKIIEDMLRNIDEEVDAKLKRKYFSTQSQCSENYLELPLNVYMLWDKLYLYPMNDEDQIVYTLHIATDVNTGKLSIQYQGEDDTFLSHKKIIKAIKLENDMYYARKK